MPAPGSQPPNSPDPQPDPRIDRLEEAHLFAERRADDLAEQLLAVEQKLRETLDRVRRLEENFTRLDQAMNDNTDPDDDLP